jgi:hypothetical protein
MTTASPRATFVSNEFRYAIVEDLAVLDDEPSAREIIIDTNLSEEAATTVARQYLASLKGVPLAFEVVVEDIIDLDDFRGCPPIFRLSAVGYEIDELRVFRVIGTTCNYLTGRSTLRVRG